jgi:hypothetical protein
MWLKDKYRDEFYNILFPVLAAEARPEFMNKKLAEFLSSKGYTNRVTSKGDIIFFMNEEDYIWLKLKYD